MSLIRKAIPALVTFFISFPTWAQSADCDPLAHLERKQGIVKVQPQGAVMPLRKVELPHALCEGDQVFTLKNGTAKLRYPTGELVLAENSKVRIQQMAELKLEEGTALFEVSKREQGLALQAHTPLVVIGVKGTQFLLSSTEKVNNVALVRGLIDVTRQDKKDMAYYRAKPVSEMSFAEYQKQQMQEMQDYSQQLQQEFSDYKAQMDAEFEAYKSSIELAPGQQLTLSADNEKPEAIESPINDAVKSLQRKLASWLN